MLYVHHSRDRRMVTHLPKRMIGSCEIDRLVSGYFHCFPYFSSYADVDVDAKRLLLIDFLNFKLFAFELPFLLFICPALLCISFLNLVSCYILVLTRYFDLTGMDDNTPYCYKEFRHAFTPLLDIQKTATWMHRWYIAVFNHSLHVGIYRCPAIERMPGPTRLKSVRHTVSFIILPPFMWGTPTP